MEPSTPWILNGNRMRKSWNIFVTDRESATGFGSHIKE